MIRALTRLLKWAATAYLLMTLALLAWTFAWPEPAVDRLDPADAIVCLGGGMTPDGVLDPAVERRVARCVQLYQAAIAPVVVFSDGAYRPDGPNGGAQMANHADGLGLPGGAILIEPNALSTLQNGLFSLALLPDAQRIVIVSEAFHLPRVYASFHWAAWQAGHPRLEIALVMSEPVRHVGGNGPVHWPILARESLAIWFNVGRAVAYSVAPRKTIDWLR